MKQILKRIFAFMMSVICMMTFITICEETAQIENKVLADEEDMWKLVWNDEFDGTVLDISKWNTNGATGAGGYGNNELQNYQPEYSEVKDGNLIIKPQFQWDTQKEQPIRQSCYSTKLWTKGQYSVQYGKIEFRAKMPKGQGTWAAGWMIGDSLGWPECGELDIFETTMDPLKQTITQELHCPKFNGLPFSSGSRHWDSKITDETSGYHTYGVIWTAKDITFTIDGTATGKYNPSLYSMAVNPTSDNEIWPFNQPFYLNLSCAIGGVLGGDVTPDGWTEIARNGDIATYEDYYNIDWIRVYEANDNSKDDAGKIIELNADAYQIDSDIQIDVSCKAAGDVDMYQIQVSNDKYFSDYASFDKTYSSKDGMCTIKLNKSSFENYAYVRVRARALVNVGKIYGNWSEILSVYLPEEDDSDSDDQQNNAKWSIDENGTLYWSEGNVNEDGYSLEDEIPWYDQKDKIKNVVVGEGVDYISNYTFMYCENLETITIPAGVESIGPFAFCGCNNLKSINIATNNPNYVSVDGVLFNKSKTEIVIYPSAKEGKYVIPNTVTTIGENSFRECGKLSDLVIPSSVTTIGAYAFYDCTSLLNITIPKSVKEMDYCGLGLIFYKGFVGDIDDRIDGFIMKGYVGSAAETYARDNGLTFKYIANEVTNPETTTPASEQKAITSSNNTKPTLPVAENKTTSSNSNVNATLKKAVVTKLKSVKAAKKSLKISWKKVKGVSGYQVQISNSGKFKKATKTVTVKKANTTSKTIKKLKSKKQYYVRIRTYIIVNGTKKYSDWSKAKSKKTK